MSDKSERLRVANQVIRIISDRGRRFFYSHAHQRVGRFVLEQGRLLFIDPHTGARIDIVRVGRWDGFTGAGDLQRIVEDLARYVTSGKPVDPEHFGPWPKTANRGDQWGYGVVMDDVRRLIAETGVMAAEECAEERRNVHYI